MSFADGDRCEGMARLLLLGLCVGQSDSERAAEHAAKKRALEAERDEQLAAIDAECRAAMEGGGIGLEWASGLLTGEVARR